MNATDRPVPQNIELEQAMLGAILCNNDAFHRVSDFLEPPHFHEPLHAKIFEILASLIGEGRCATPVTVKTFLPSDFKVVDLTIDQYLARLVAEATSVINAGDYGRHIRDLAIRRELVRIGEDIAEAACSSTNELDALLNGIERDVCDLATAASPDAARFKLIPFKDLKLSAEPEYLIERLYPRSGLAVVWGGPKSGKSFFVMDSTLHVALGREYRGRRVHQGSIVYCAF